MSDLAAPEFVRRAHVKSWDDAADRYRDDFLPMADSDNIKDVIAAAIARGLFGTSRIMSYRVVTWRPRGPREQSIVFAEFAQSGSPYPEPHRFSPVREDGEWIDGWIEAKP